MIKQQLEVKLNLLNDMDKEILACCELNVIATELEELEAVTAKIISGKQKIEKLTDVTPVTSTPASPMVHASLPSPSSVTVINHNFLDCSFRDLEVMLRIGQPSGTPLNHLFTGIWNCQRWTSLTI